MQEPPSLKPSGLKPHDETNATKSGKSSGFVFGANLADRVVPQSSTTAFQTPIKTNSDSDDDKLKASSLKRKFDAITREEDEQTVLQIGSPESDDHNPKEDICVVQNGIALLFLLTNMILNFLVLAIIHERAPLQSDPLPDILHVILPEAAWGLDVAEYIISIQTFSLFILLFLHRYRVIIFRRLCLIIGLLYMYRGICMMSTQVPLLKKDYCAPKISDDPSHSPDQLTTGLYIQIIFSRVFHMMLGFGLSINGKQIYCGDYLYSGHTVILTFCYLTLREYLIPLRCRTLVWRAFNILALSSSIIGVIFILIARGHYTIDIVLAYYVTTRTFWIFHTIVYNHGLRFPTHTNYLSRVWWWPLFKYFEFNHIRCTTRRNGLCSCCDSATLTVPRVFEWPMPWPKSPRRRSTSSQRLLNQTQTP